MLIHRCLPPVRHHGNLQGMQRKHTWDSFFFIPPLSGLINLGPMQPDSDLRRR